MSILLQLFMLYVPHFPHVLLHNSVTVLSDVIPWIPEENIFQEVKGSDSLYFPMTNVPNKMLLFQCWASEKYPFQSSQFPYSLFLAQNVGSKISLQSKKEIYSSSKINGHEWHWNYIYGSKGNIKENILLKVTCGWR